MKKLPSPNKNVAFQSLWLLMAASMFLTASLYAQDSSFRINTYAESYQPPASFSGVILVAHQDQVVFSQGYGIANRTTKQANTPQTVFRIASLTKQFTAAAILLLQEQGRLTVQDRLCQYIENCPAAWRQITIHHLLTHTAGVFNYTDLPGSFFFTRTPHTVEQLIDRFRKKDPEFAPGSQWAYSNSGYCLLGYIIEKASGTSYGTYLQDNLFRPLRMKATGYPPTRGATLNQAQGYVTWPFGILKASYVHPSVAYAAGGLVSTAEDLQQWHQALYTHALLSLQSVRLLTTAYANSFGYGVRIDEQAGRKRISHGGRLPGVEHYMAYYPADKLSIVVLSNRPKSKAEHLTKAIARAWFIQRKAFSK